MKKLITLIAVITILGCAKNNPQPQPNIVTIPNTQTTPISNVKSPNIYQFIGNWNCTDWVVDDITGTTHRREFIFIKNTIDSTMLNISLNDYNSNGTYSQLITKSIAYVDSNYFDNPTNPITIKFDGYLINDSTMSISQYDGNTVYQTRTFKK